MQPAGLVLLMLIFSLAHTFHFEWPTERGELEDRPEYREQLTADDDDLPVTKSFSSTLVRQRRSKKLCGKKFIEHLLILCNSCILPAGSEIVKRSLIDETARETVQRLMKRELSIAKKCCEGQCKMSELEALCCKNG
ncbi:hypothetical protein GCK32_004562 [Trichostrongylus colubriformis]|uniref:Insulin-like domain-containing protein n=1 Tax=Trichostrongylus colubriformis TaxID=6319 RepID=A0AAN8J0T2_TRICO